MAAPRMPLACPVTTRTRARASKHRLSSSRGPVSTACAMRAITEPLKSCSRCRTLVGPLRYFASSMASCETSNSPEKQLCDHLFKAPLRFHRVYNINNNCTSHIQCDIMRQTEFPCLLESRGQWPLPLIAGAVACLPGFPPFQEAG